jgi:hypothetical protein
MRVFLSVSGLPVFDPHDTSLLDLSLEGTDSEVW